MKFIEFNIAKPPFDVRECQQRGLTFAAAVRAKLQMIIYDRESHPAEGRSRRSRSRRSTWARCRS
jgi:DNA-directed RNA polymerase subunit beta